MTAWSCDNRDPTANQIGHQFWKPTVIVLSPAMFNSNISAFHESGFTESFVESGHKNCGCSRRAVVDKSNNRHRRLLRAHRERPRDCRAAEQRDERAAPHSITSSAMASSEGGTVRPIVLAVCALMTSSNLL